MPSSSRQRLDEALVARGLAPSRARARDAIRRGTVTVDGHSSLKPGATVRPDQVVVVEDAGLAYVSRGALKLVAALDAFGFDPRGRHALDLGASTGGFTQVLLERGARSVHAIEVGHDQLDPGLAADPRIVRFDGLNARDLDRKHISAPIEAIVADLSFIALRIALPPALALAEAGCWGVFLVKPQFEAGREHVGKGGIVRDPAVAERVAEETARWLRGMPGWRIHDLIPSPIQGGDGNREFLLGGLRD